jgi:hypothetical protein
MNPHAGTCLHNEGARCTCEDSRYKGHTVKSWNTCAAHRVATPSWPELIINLGACAEALDHLAEKALGEYRGYYADRALQCRLWLADLKEGRRIGDEDIIAL